MIRVPEAQGGEARTPWGGTPVPGLPPGSPLASQLRDVPERAGPGPQAPASRTPGPPQAPLFLLKALTVPGRHLTPTPRLPPKGPVRPSHRPRAGVRVVGAGPRPSLGPGAGGPPGPSSVDHVSSGFKGKPDEKALSRLWQVSLSPLLSCESPDVSGSPLGASGGAGPGAGGAGSRTPLHGREPSCRPGSPDPPPCNKPTLTARHPGRAAGPGGGALAPRELH